MECPKCGREMNYTSTQPLCPRCQAEPWYTPPPAPQQPPGWECPRCRVVHAPWVAACNCSPPARE